MSKVIGFILRLIAFPFMAVIVGIHSLRIYCITMFGYLIYGGEAIVYSKKINRTKIADVYLKVSEMVDNKDCINGLR